MMKALVKPIIMTGEAEYVQFDLRKAIENPIIRADKASTPLYAFCNLVANPPRLENGRIHATTEAILEYTAIQLDYDSGKTIDEFIGEYKDKFMFALYTSYSYGFKPCDRFRVIIPLKEPLPQSEMGFNYMDVMEEEFHGCDGSAFARAHFQCVPCIRAPGAPYRYYFNRINKYYEIPYKRIREYKNKVLNILAFDSAVEAWKEEWHLEEEQNYDGAIRWAQEQLDAMSEGNRNNTMFKVLAFLVRVGVPYGHASGLLVPQECDGEWERMLTRFYNCKY